MENSISLKLANMGGFLYAMGKGVRTREVENSGRLKVEGRCSFAACNY